MAFAAWHRVSKFLSYITTLRPLPEIEDLSQVRHKSFAWVTQGRVKLRAPPDGCAPWRVPRSGPGLPLGRSCPDQRDVKRAAQGGYVNAWKPFLTVWPRIGVASETSPSFELKEIYGESDNMKIKLLAAAVALAALSSSGAYAATSGDNTVSGISDVVFQALDIASGNCNAFAFKHAF